VILLLDGYDELKKPYQNLYKINNWHQYQNIQVIITCRRNSKIIEEAIIDKRDFKEHFSPDDNQMIELNIPLFSED